MPSTWSHLSSTDMIAHYARKFSANKLAVDATALRTESLEYRKVIAWQATDGALTYSQLKELLLHDRPDIVRAEVTQPNRLASLGRVALLQDYSSEDRLFGIKCLELASEMTPLHASPRKFRRLLIQDAIISDEKQRAITLLDNSPDIDEEYYGYLRAELMNPFIMSGSKEDQREWEVNFNLPFVHHGLSPVTLSATGEKPFDRLQGLREPSDLNPEHPTVTVVMTTYKPERSGLLTSVRSILDQTWHKLDLIIVDDASGNEFEEVLSEVEDLDSRIRVIRCKTNGGTYRARNIGYRNAMGDFITGQDDDDWSHPERLQMQVEALVNNPLSPASRSRAISCNEYLSRVRLDYAPEGANASSLMVRKSVFDLTGGFLPIRKAADNEFAKRIEAITGYQIRDIDKPLAIIRILNDSLSRSHFRAGWQHPARRQFKSMYRHWHKTARIENLRLEDHRNLPLAIPRAVSESPNSKLAPLDVLYLGDWRDFEATQEAMTEEMLALREAGLEIGILHLESPRLLSISTKPLSPQVQELVNTGVIREVLLDDPVKVRLAIINDPTILQFLPPHKASLTISQFIIKADETPALKDGTEVKYIPIDCSNKVETTFSISPIWAPQWDLVYESLAEQLGEETVFRIHLPEVVNPSELQTERRYRRSMIPVVGRFAHNNRSLWLNNDKVQRVLYPTDGRADIRFHGDVGFLRDLLSLPQVPPGWTVFSSTELSPQEFLNMLDFFVYFPDNRLVTHQSVREILGALAAGLVVVLPHYFKQVFGPAALYRSYTEVPATIRYFHENREAYAAQSKTAIGLVRDSFSPESYLATIDSIFRETEESITNHASIASE